LEATGSSAVKVEGHEEESTPAASRRWKPSSTTIPRRPPGGWPRRV